MVQGVRHLFFGPVVACSITPQWWTFRPKHVLSTGINLLGGEFIGWTIRKVVHPCRSNSLVDNPQADKSTIYTIILTYLIVERYPIRLLVVRVARLLRDKVELGHVVGVGAHLELAALGVQGELVEAHGADEGDVGGLAVHHRPTCVDPEAGQLGEHVDDLVGLEVVDEDVGDPEVLDKLQVHGDVLGVGRVVGVLRIHVQASLLYTLVNFF